MKEPSQLSPRRENEPREKLRVAAVQYEHAANDKQANLAKVRGFVEQASNERVTLIAFPECCLTGYWHLRNMGRAELESLAEPVFEGPSTQELLSLARTHNMVIGAGLIELACDGTLYNTYIVAMPDGNAHKHRKLHAFVSEHISSGSDYTVFEGPNQWRIGVLVCYDNNIVENARITALMGTDILLAPHQTGGCAMKNPHVMGKIDVRLWENRHKDPEAIEAEFRGPKGRDWLMRWLPSRAHDQGVFLVFSNGVGVDDDEIRTGNAMIIDPYGRILRETWRAADDMVIADLDPGLLENSTGRQWMKARRPDLYPLIAQPTGKEDLTRQVRFDQ
jgi:predicted amidohydrolase